MAAMEDICGGEKPFITTKSVETRHKELLNEAIDSFDKIPKMGGKEFSESYREQLMMELDQAFEHFEAQNKSKNMFKYVFRTVLFLSLVISSSDGTASLLRAVLILICVQSLDYCLIIL